ncbi:MAG: polysaccharide biosynthesis/export family protein [Akkermansiaceae bacterium]|nr:polysaccharide biosynthesis/export family protein [Akkermansiaceae bacterium]
MKKILRMMTLLSSILAFATVAASAQEISSRTTLNIAIKGVPATEQQRISGQYVVDGSGFVYLPLLKGGIKASGLSSSSLARKIEDAYRSAEMYENPRITVISTKDEASSEIDRQIVSIGGFVKSPGPKPYMRGMTLFQAVSAAGGETAFGSIKRVELHRNGKKYVYNLQTAAHMRVKVYPGDSINVPQKTAFGN